MTCFAVLSFYLQHNCNNSTTAAVGSLMTCNSSKSSCDQHVLPMLMGRDEEDAMMSLSRGRACVAYRLQRNGVIIPYFACVQFANDSRLACCSFRIFHPPAMSTQSCYSSKYGSRISDGNMDAESDPAKHLADNPAAAAYL